MKRFIRQAVVAAVWIAVWQCAYLIVGKPVLLPGVSQTLSAMLGLAKSYGFWLSILSSVLRVLGGFLMGTVFGCLFAFITYVSGYLRDLFRPIMTVIKATPVASFIILAFVWIPVNYVPVFTSFLIVTPIFWTNIYDSAGNTDKGLLEMSRVYEMKRTSVLTKIYIPSVMPSFVSSVTSSIGMAWKASIAAEVICRSRSSIGGGLYAAKIAIDTDKVFAWTLIVIALSLVFEKLAVVIINRLFKRWVYA